MFLGIYPFCPGFPVCWHIIIHNVFLQSFVFLCCQLFSLLFHFWFYLFRSFLFFVFWGFFFCFFWWVWLKVCHFAYLFKKPALGLIDLLYYFFRLYFIYFCSDCYYFLPFTYFVLCLLFFFFSSFKYEIRLFEFFSCFLR